MALQICLRGKSAIEKKVDCNYSSTKEVRVPYISMSHIWWVFGIAFEKGGLKSRFMWGW